MTLKERISDIFEKYSVELAVEEKEETQEVALMATAVLESGQEIMTDADAFAVGVSAFVVNDEGERIPLPDGDYQLQDGSMLVVAEGAVAEMKEAEAEVEAEEEKEEEMKAEEVTEEVQASSEVLTREAVEGMIAEAIEATKKESFRVIFWGFYI